ncbi:MAG: radical SAM protein [Deltaproteobacteria bacterium GWC2_42_11]|nr:MAG: radical SAM protein [Deltaproteobacteria bacterium GWC2_42_11]HBO83751.1 radical SAM protein [Deltaproteobacteria bacterium]
MSFQPSYIKLYETGELNKRIDALNTILENCHLCPRDCGANRLQGEKGVCRIGSLPIVSSFHAHFGEERPLVGCCGSGTIFLTYCNLKCLFCQNYDISHLGEGREIFPEELAAMMTTLMRQGCHNINFVTPTHQTAQIVSALPYVIEKGLEIPLVYNCGGYESVETIKLLDGIFDIYMPDFKYGSNDVAKKLSAASDYVDRAKESIKEMHRQVGDLKMDKRGIAEQGLLIRHLVLPDGIAGTREVMRFIATEISKNTYINIMDQYRPCYKAFEHPPMNRMITKDEFEEAVRIAREKGLERLDGFI